MSDYIDREAFLEQKRTQYCNDCVRRKGMKNGKYKTLYEIGEAPCRACEIDDVLNDVEDFPAADVREVVHCKDCGHWNRKHQQTAKWSRDKVAMCAWWSRSYGTIQTTTNDFCSYGYIEAEVDQK